MNETHLTYLTDVNSLNSDYADSDADNDIKAIQFFSKENTTRINIGKQKMMAWKTKLKDGLNCNSSKKSPEITSKNLSPTGNAESMLR